SLEKVDNGTDSTTALSNNSSRIGFKGVEKIGGGLSAILSVEWGLAGLVDGGGSAVLGNRNQFVGLTGGFGTLLAGRHDTPVKLISRRYDMWGDTIGDTAQFTGIADGGAPFEQRTANTIAYVSPKIAGGLTLTLAHVLDHDIAGCNAASNSPFPTGDDNDCSASSASLVWDKGMFNAAVGYETHSIDTPGAKDETMLRAGLGLKFKPARVNLFYQQSEDTGFAANDGRTVMGVGIGVKLGKGELKGQYYVADDFDNQANTGATMYNIGYDYPLSKMASVYALYHAVNNDSGARLGMNHPAHGDKSGVPTAVNQDPNAIAVGMRVRF
ncbi:MAG: porin, partial [Thiotrichales bacterium]